jgi:DNA-binding NtrC family response regulator
MTTSDTLPRIQTRPAQAPDADVGVLVHAGSALGGRPPEGDRLTLVDRAVAIGRDDTALHLGGGRDDRFMSRTHAMIGRGQNGGFYWVRDLGSTNGTWLDGTRLPAGTQRRLHNGAVLMMGAHVFVFRRMTPDDIDAIREDAESPLAPVATASPALAALARKLRRLAPAPVDLLLTGETGVGKEVHAEAVHRASGRAGPFIAVDCAAIPQNLVEGQLFGEARGAPATADRSPLGLLEQAAGGTLFLDEIGELPQAAQTRLLRFLQNRQLLTPGSPRAHIVDVRVIAATNRPTAENEAEDGLRFDLAARLGPEPLRLLPLRDRPEDIGVLALSLGAVGAAGYTPEAYLALYLHTWKGNVRELGKVLAVAKVLAQGAGPVELGHLPKQIAARVDVRGGDRARRKRPTREQLVALLARHAGDVARVAREIGRQRTLVWRWLREDSVRVDDYRA